LGEEDGDVGRATSYPPELRDRAVRMVAEVRPEYQSDWAAIKAVAGKLGIGTAETLRKWVRQSEVDGGMRPGGGRAGAAHGFQYDPYARRVPRTDRRCNHRYVLGERRHRWAVPQDRGQVCPGDTSICFTGPSELALRHLARGTAYG
jgi:transposase